MSARNFAGSWTALEANNLYWTRSLSDLFKPRKKSRVHGGGRAGVDAVEGDEICLLHRDSNPDWFIHTPRMVKNIYRRKI
jgi:hypothetical protein